MADRHQPSERVEDRANVSIVLLDNDGSELHVHQPEDLEFAEAAQRASTWINDHVDYRATPGPRLGPTPGSDTRRGSPEDVVTPLHVAPHRALAVASGRSVVDRPLGPLRIEADTCETEGSFDGGLARLSYRANLRTSRFRRRAASLRLRPSPSNNLTIIELVPVRRPWFWTKSFVRAGVPAVQELCARLTVECDAEAA